MAKFYPTYETIKKLKVQPEEGELHLLNYFKNNLSDDFEVYFQTFLNGDRPDIILMRENYGVMIIEVKDWNLSNYYLDERKKWRLKQNNAYLKSPIDQVLQYKENIFNLHIENLLEKKIKNFKYWMIVSCAVYFHKATESNLKNLLIEPYNDNRKYQDFLKYNIDLIGYDNINQNDFNKILRKRYLKTDYYTSKYFTPDLYESFKRYFKPPLHTLEEGKTINYNKTQKHLIISAARDQRIKGVVGSGKTTILAARAVNAHKRTDDKVLILTYNITLKNYIHDKISDVRAKFAWNNFYITNYHAFITTEFNNLGIEFEIPSNFLEWSTEAKSNYFETNYYSNIAIFELVKDRIQKYKTILIDEIQDYKLEWMRIIKKYFLVENGEYVLFGDEKQNIYDNELENKDIKTNVQQRPSEIKISNRFNDKIGKIAIDFQKQCFENKYYIDDIITQKSLAFETTKYLFINDCKIDTIYDTTQKLIQSLKVHPNDIAILGFTINLMRRFDCFYRYKSNEKTNRMFETQEIWFKLLLDANSKNEIIKSGIDLFWKSKWLSPDEKKGKLSVLLSIKELLKNYSYSEFDNHYNRFLEKFKINKERFEEWCSNKEFKELVKTQSGYKFHNQIKKVRDNKKLHFWFNSGTIKVSTIHSFKGWEAQTLFLIIEPKYEGGDFVFSFEELIYTGLTRSKSNLIVLNYGNMEFHKQLETIFKAK